MQAKFDPLDCWNLKIVEISKRQNLKIVIHGAEGIQGKNNN